MKVHLLGTGRPVPSLKRASAGYVVRTGGDVIVFDHGDGAHWRFLQAGFRAVDVTHVFISHLHYDHCIDFIRLFLNRWDHGAGRIPSLKMYGPPGFQAFVDRLFGPRGPLPSISRRGPTIWKASRPTVGGAAWGPARGRRRRLRSLPRVSEWRAAAGG